MPIKKGREYRALQDFSLIPREGENDAYRVRGTAVVFDSPTCLYEYDGVKYYEVIDRHAFDGCDMSDVIMNYNHGGKVVARLRNKTLSLNITDRGVDMEADLSGTAAGRDLYEEIDGGYDKGPIIEAATIRATITPSEIAALKLAIPAAMELGYGREVVEENDEIDLGLAELNAQKKTT